MTSSWCSKVNIFGGWFGSTAASIRNKATPTEEELSLQEEERGNDDAEREQEQKDMLLRGQKEREDLAIAAGKFVKNQRARYVHKATEEWFDAWVVGVHLDDGPDNPYYTIQYHSRDGEWIEKQTTSNRMAFVKWDTDLSWKILSKKLRS